jgi:acyl dehydratase
VCRFKAPVRLGDTLASQWRVTEKLDKPKHNGGIAVLKCACTNQNGDLVLEADGKILVASRPRS